MAYTYPPLDATRHEIRLLRLRPAAALDAPLRIRLFSVSLDDSLLPVYEALSYAWGTSPPCCPVWVEEEDEQKEEEEEEEEEPRADIARPSLLVTPNLDAALRHLRYRGDNGDGTDDRLLWVDALCINQRDLAERSRQVQQMRRIYEHCTADLAWLGPNPDYGHRVASQCHTKGNDNGDKGDKDDHGAAATTAAARYTRQQAKHMRAGLALMRRVADRDARTLSAMVQPRSETETDDDDDDDDDEDKGTTWLLSYSQVHSLRTAFSEADLWTRVWIVQELSCAPRVVLVVGTDEKNGGDGGDGSSSSSDVDSVNDVVNTESDTTDATRSDSPGSTTDRIVALDWDRDVVGGFLSDQAYADAFHSHWSHGMIGPAAARIFARARAIQLQRSRTRAAAAAAAAAAPATDDDTATTAEATTLLDVLARFKWTHATDPRDKVYGLLGLVAEAPRLLPAVDYTRPPAVVYTDAALAVLRTAGCLDVVSQNPFGGAEVAADRDGDGDGDEDEDGDGKTKRGELARLLPSWVPNFDSTNYVDYNDELATILFAQRGIYAAGRASCPSAPLRQVRPILGSGGDPFPTYPTGLPVRGTVLGHIAPLRQGVWTELGAGYLTARNVLGRLRTWQAAYVAADSQGTYATYATGETRARAFWRTTVADCTAYPIRRLAADEREDWAGRLAAVCAQRAEERAAVEAAGLGPEDTDEEESWRSSPAEQALYDGPCWRMLQRMVRRWGVAETVSDGHGGGGLFLLVRATARAGDVVAVLDGSKVPVVLRPREDVLPKADDEDDEDDDENNETNSSCYEYVCPAYVHGYMDGEAVTQVEQGTRTEQSFVLV
ncbi:het domain containing protein [Niveomyces insectorum RCEF 264]|uniref:Het domain containing protein n=1 Tax=Niveomyces insectorum RCEF 264 TaxID=1081102 RepID=A0A167SGV4_9HYPO|nr:het domain containing protein [Niveomyces insectorum RCEF 264]